MKRNTCLAVFIGMAVSTAFAAPAPSDYSIQLTATIDKAAPKITLNWAHFLVADGSGYSIYRKAPEASDWGTALATVSASTYSYEDKNVAVGVGYEYKVAKAGGTHSATGFMYSGIELPAVENRGTLILLVDNTQSSGQATELTRLQQDLNNDGWKVIRHDVSRTAKVPDIKKIITTDYNADPKNVKSVFLFGHVPVPYSGQLNPDGHGEHKGAWPADGYYGDMDGEWTDNTIKTGTGLLDSRNSNIPGDGKFDQSLFPSDIELEIGRVDFQKMSLAKSESELLKNYLNKDHNFRVKAWSLQKRALVQDQFQDYSNCFLSAMAFSSFSPMFGPSKIDIAATEAVFPTLKTKDYLWTYSTGPGGWTDEFGLGPGGANDVEGFTVNDTKTVFVGLWGSYFGDWDVANSLLRGAIAAPTYTLTCAWAGVPFWYFEHMALGKEIGYSTKLSMNNNTLRGFPGIGTNWGKPRSVSMGLMGDPTLRQDVVAPPTNLVATELAGTSVKLSWTASVDQVLGYNVYRSNTGNGDFIKVNNTLVTGTSFTDNQSPTGVYTYTVRALKLETPPSGSYYNLSQGVSRAKVSHTSTSGIHAPSAPLFLGTPVKQELIGLNGAILQTIRPSESKATGADFDKTALKPGIYLVRSFDAKSTSTISRLVVTGIAR